MFSSARVGTSRWTYFRCPVQNFFDLYKDAVAGTTNEISDGSACVTIALIQMRKANVSFQDISSFAQRGLELTNGDTRSTQEFWIRLKTYYPDATL